MDLSNCQAPAGPKGRYLLLASCEQRCWACKLINVSVWIALGLVSMFFGATLVYSTVALLGSVRY